MTKYDEDFVEQCSQFEKCNSKTYKIYDKKSKRSLMKQIKRKHLKILTYEPPSTPPYCANDSSISGYNTLGSSGHKGSLRGTKLARRARSFKEDFMEKISQMRTPNDTLTRSHSPKEKRSTLNLHENSNIKQPQSINSHVRVVQHSLKHFKDVISKNKLEMLHGNGTIILEAVACILTDLRAYKFNDQSSAIISATQQLHHALGKLIKLCDEVLLCENESECAALNKDNVNEVVDLVEGAVTNLVDIANKKIAEETSATKQKRNNALLHCPLVDNSAGQRTSLPDIPLTPKERENLEKNVFANQVRQSQSSESVLREPSPSPPPKPPKIRPSTGPPLPPRKKTHDESFHDVDCMTNQFLLCGNLNRLSSRSKSPEDNSDLFSTGSADSMLNSSQVNEETKKLNNDEADNIMGSSRLFSPDHRRSNESGFMSFNSPTCNDFNLQSSQQHENIFMSKKLYTQKNMNLFSQTETKLTSMTTDFKNININISTSSNNIEMANAVAGDDELKPPPLPVKRKNRIFNNEQNNQNDTINEMDQICVDFDSTKTSSTSSLTSTSTIISSTNSLAVQGRIEGFDQLLSNVRDKNRHMSCIEPRRLERLISEDKNGSTEQPPPLPMKKKHIMAYMEIFGNASHSSHFQNKDSSFVRHSMHTFSSDLNHFQEHLTLSHGISISSDISKINSESSNIIPPALPPKRRLCRSPNLFTPPASPRIFIQNITEINDSPNPLNDTEAPPGKSFVFDTSNENETQSTGSQNLTQPFPMEENDRNEPAVILRNKSKDKVSRNLMEELEVGDYLVFKKDNEDGPDIKGGHSDALIIHATKIQKTSESFGEAFLTTFRTFIEPLNLINKLTTRYMFFNCYSNDHKQRAAKESFSLLVRVVNDLTIPDLTEVLMQKISEFVFTLVCSGELMMAKLLRVKVIEKAIMLKNKNMALPNYLSSRPVMSNPPSLLDLKSTEIAEQMTLLDAELFQKIEIPEVLIWAKEQCEERSPNLTLFTEHFNKMSYWARTQILKQQDSKDREKHVIKFIKIMKHLRKINNYNSYLALLSALDSAPIRRLEWQKNITEGLKEYCALIDSSSSFRAYRQALSETNPPCIPYIGLVLQDLTFVHIGNPDFLNNDEFINFSKRWQQYNIVVNMKRFRQGSYGFKKNEKIIGFFDNFEEYFDEDAMWQISEKIKPRGGRKL